MNPFLKKTKEKTERSHYKTVSTSSSFLVLFTILMSLFIITITLLGFRQIKDTMRIRRQAQNSTPSFEETMSGILAMENSPDLRISKQQAYTVISVTGPYLQYLDIFSKLESAASSCLNDKQKKFILVSSGRSFNPGVKYQIPPGYTRIDWIYHDLEKFSDGMEAAAYKDADSNTLWLNRIPGIEDLVEGFYHLKQAEELTGPQAAYLTPYLKETAETYKKIDDSKEIDKEKIWSCLTDKQKEFLKKYTEPIPPDFIRTYMPDIIRLMNIRAENNG